MAQKNKAKQKPRRDQVVIEARKRGKEMVFGVKWLHQPAISCNRTFVELQYNFCKDEPNE